MPKFLCLLRGINVSGQKLIKMAKLKELLNYEGYKNVQTYIQSGNIILDSILHTKEEQSTAVEKLLKEKYGWDIPCIVLEEADLKEILELNPYKNISTKKATLPYVCLPKGELTEIEKNLLNELNFDGEHFTTTTKAIYLYSILELNKSKLSNNFFEKKLKRSCTSRNWRTLNKLNDIIGST